MREREEYIKDIWIEIILRSAKMLDADFTMPHDIARERAFTEVIGRVLDKREALAAATRVLDRWTVITPLWCVDEWYDNQKQAEAHARLLNDNSRTTAYRAVRLAALEGPRDE